MKTSTYAPFAKPLYVMVKPVGAVCNLACDYCYYLEKANLYKDNPKHVMSDELLEKFIDEYINSQTMPQVLFTWHGGETLMRPLSFYKKAMELQKKYARGRTIDNCIQTNGTMLTDEWCEFFRENNWLVGVSIDGPQEFHDEYRKNKMGKPSFVKVMQGINLLKKHGVEWNAMAVINDFNADYPLDFYHFFKEIDCKYIQFAPIVERILEHQDGRHLASLAENQKGELVLTNLEREGMPIIRFRTKDLTSLTYEPCECGRTSARMSRITGRADDMIKVKGVAIFPSQIEKALLKVGDVEPHYLIIVTRPGTLDQIEVKVEASKNLFFDGVKEMVDIQSKIAKSIENETGIRVKVTLVEPKSLPRYEGKAKRVIDKRNLH